MLERQAMRAGPVHVQLRLAPCLRLITKSCVTSKRLYIARIAGSSKKATRPFPLEGKLLGCFCEVRFPVFSSWPSTWTVLSSMLSCSEIYRRFTGGFARNRGLLGHSVRTVRSMQNLQMPCPAGFSSKSLASGDVVQLVRTL